jgi:signal transduction histidine kinase
MWSSADPGELLARIADQLHDGPMQTLAAALMHLTVIERSVDPEATVGRQIIETHDLVRQSSVTLRRTVDMLRKTVGGNADTEGQQPT